MLQCPTALRVFYLILSNYGLTCVLLISILELNLSVVFMFLGGAPLRLGYASALKCPLQSPPCVCLSRRIVCDISVVAPILTKVTRIGILKLPVVPSFQVETALGDSVNSSSPLVNWTPTRAHWFDLTVRIPRFEYFELINDSPSSTTGLAQFVDAKNETGEYNRRLLYKTVQYSTFLHVRRVDISSCSLNSLSLSIHSVPLNKPSLYSDLFSRMRQQTNRNNFTSIGKNKISILAPLIGVEVLNLSRNNFEQLSAEDFWPRLTYVHVTVLDLERNRLKHFGKEVFSTKVFPKLRRLVLSFNLLDSLPAEVLTDASHLQHLDLEGNPIHQIDASSMAKLPNQLEYFNIRQLGRPLKIAPDVFCAKSKHRDTRIGALNFLKSGLDNFLRGIYHSESMRQTNSTDISHQQWNLKWLDLSNNHLVLAAFLCWLSPLVQNLKKVDLTNCWITHSNENNILLPDEFAYLNVRKSKDDFGVNVDSRNEIVHPERHKDTLRLNHAFWSEALLLFTENQQICPVRRPEHVNSELYSNGDVSQFSVVGPLRGQFRIVHSKCDAKINAVSSQFARKFRRFDETSNQVNHDFNDLSKKLSGALPHVNKFGLHLDCTNYCKKIGARNKATIQEIAIGVFFIPLFFITIL